MNACGVRSAQLGHSRAPPPDAEDLEQPAEKNDFGLALYRQGLIPHLWDVYETQDLLVPTVANNNVMLQAKLTDGQVVPAKALSEGLLYFLGFTALQHLDDTGLFLVETPENGLHPARIAEVMEMLRELSKTSQVLIATHSPLVVNEMGGHEVTVLTRDQEKGARGTLLKDVPGFEKATEVYATGKWRSRC